MRNDEIIAVKSFTEFLKNCGIPSSWEEGSNPPDAVFKVSSERWAVEVTGLHRYVKWRGSIASETTIYAGLGPIIKELNDKISFPPNKLYLLTIMGTFPFRPLKRQIISRIKSYINSGQTDSEPLEQSESILIRAVELEGQSGIELEIVGLGVNAMNADGKQASQVYPVVNFSIDQILGEKLPRLKTLLDYDRRILLIVREYFGAEAFIVKEILAQKELSQDSVDSVFLVSSENEIECVADSGLLFSK